MANFTNALMFWNKNDPATSAWVVLFELYAVKGITLWHH